MKFFNFFKINGASTYITLGITFAFLTLIIGAIFFTQVNSGQNIQALQESNFTAAQTFDINNRLQELVNTAQGLQAKTQKAFFTKKNIYTVGMSDTITLLSKQAADLKFILNKRAYPETDNLFAQLKNETEYAKAILKQFSGHDSLTKSSDAILARLPQPNDSIYTMALGLQKDMEKNLKESFRQSNLLSVKASQLSKFLSILATFSIALLGTIIIYRIVKQLSLINKLAVEKQRADTSAKIKEQFLANMSHEIRTPINAVIGFTNLLQKTDLKTEQQQFASLIQSSGQNLLSLINDILDVSKLEAGKMQFSATLFKLRDTCIGIEKLFQYKMDEKGISFSLRIDKTIPATLIGDVVRLNQVLNNLMSNAIKFTEHGSIHITVQALHKTKKLMQLQFMVKDSGIGIPQEKWQSIFQRFEQADADTTRQYGGTGLGLAIVKDILQLQGGDIYVQSKPGEGSEFIFTIEYGYVPNEAQAEQPVILPEEERVTFNKATVLLAEDNKVNQTLLQFVFKQWNLTYDLAENGEQAINCLKQKTYDLVILDIQMPVLDGYDTAKHIRNHLKLSVPLVAMTAHVLPGEKQKCIDAGMNDYISKPINEKELVLVLKKYLSETTVMREATLPDIDKFKYINFVYLFSAFQQDTNFIREILREFVVQYPHELSLLQMAIEHKKGTETNSLAHNLKTTISVLKTSTLTWKKLDEIEKNASTGNWDRVQIELNGLLEQKDMILMEVNSFANT